MSDKTRIGIICDLHLSDSKAAPQYAFLKTAVEQMRKDAVDAVVCLGDVTSHGEVAGYGAYKELLCDFSVYEVSGNSDVRDTTTADKLVQLFQKSEFYIDKRKVVGIHTPYACISNKDRKRLSNIKAGDVIFLHHDIASLEEESRGYLTELAKKIPLIIIHGHTHKRIEHWINGSHIIGVKCLDPDKCIGSYPCITYLDISEDGMDIIEQQIDISEEVMESVSKNFGISCVDNAKDVAYALEHSIKNIELRCIDDWKPDMTILPLIEEWRNKTKGYLSVHMPDIRIKNQIVVGKEQWYQAVDYANLVGADGLTMHTPRVKKFDIPYGGERWNEILDLYIYVAENVKENTKLGIENLHVNKGENVDENRGFGYTPEEVSLWIDSINQRLGKENRVGHVLDVGHARNNGSLAESYPVSRWYEIMGRRTVAYHIHQVVPTEDGYSNHCAIEEWFGPMINYTSFFYSWGQKMLNHVPVFLEVKGYENFEKSIKAFERMKGNKK